MTEDEPSIENAGKKHEQPAGWWTWSRSETPGWWTASPLEPSNNFGSVTSTKFFDNPPLLFAAFMWSFPYCYSYICFFTMMAIALLFRACGARASDYIPVNSLAVFAAVAPLLFFAILLVKGRWFLNNLLGLLLVWFLLGLTSGVTQGAITAALSKAYCAGN